MNGITMKELFERIDHLNQDEIVLDVRTPEEFADGHVPGSRNVDHENVASAAEELKKFKRVYIHCRSGKRAQIAFQTLTSLGLDNLVCIADGGMLDWAEAGYPIEK